jgi:hypothetical protein
MGTREAARVDFFRVDVKNEFSFCAQCGLSSLAHARELHLRGSHVGTKWLIRNFESTIT